MTYIFLEYAPSKQEQLKLRKTSDFVKRDARNRSKGVMFQDVVTNRNTIP